MLITYDEIADAAYFYFDADGEGSSVDRTILVDPRDLNGGMINFDVDRQGCLVGLEVMDASNFLPQALLRPGRTRLAADDAA